MKQQQYKRRKRFIKPRLQTRMIGSFVALAALAMLLEFLLLGTKLMSVGGSLSGTGADLASEIPRVLFGAFALSCSLFLPLIFLFGVRITFRIAGPAHHLERFLKDVAEGRESQPCKIRAGDELQELCAWVNAATELPRAKNAELQAKLASIARTTEAA
jgi:hypothetical protein